VTYRSSEASTNSDPYSCVWSFWSARKEMWIRYVSMIFFLSFFSYSRISYLVIINPSLITAHTVTSYDLHRTLRTSCIKAHIVGHYLLPFRVSEHLQICTSLVRREKRLVGFSKNVRLSCKPDFQIKMTSWSLSTHIILLRNRYGHNIPISVKVYGIIFQPRRHQSHTWLPPNPWQ